MKNYILIAIISLICLSCENQLDVKSPDKLTSENFWRNKADAEAALASAYAMLECAVESYTFCETKYPFESYREDINIMGKDARNYPTWIQLGSFTYTNENPVIKNYWYYTYIGISRINQILEKMGKIPNTGISNEDRKSIEAELHFLRGYYHLKLLLNFEKIIIRDKYITNQKDLPKAPSSRDDAWTFIINELSKASDNLPEKRSNAEVGRATKNAANAYLGWAYLTRGYEKNSKEDFTAAKNALSAITGYSLVSDMLSMFNGTNFNSSESIFELQFSMNTANEAAYRPYIHRWMAVTELNGWDEILPSQKLVDEFKKETVVIDGKKMYDTRLYSTMFLRNDDTDNKKGMFDYFNDGTGKVYGDEYDNWFCVWVEIPKDSGNWEKVPNSEYNKPSYRKFLPKSYSDLKKSRVQINIPLMRYSNVLLMLAEAYTQLEQQNLAIPLINQVRSRAQMPPMSGTSKDEVMAQIKHERMLEFPLENFYWYDKCRWNEIEKSKKFYPIPFEELRTNPLAKQ